MRIGIIGAGNMGGAIYHKLKTVLPASHLRITDRHKEKIKALGATKQSTSLAELVHRSDAILLAMKPQSITEFTSELPQTLKGKLVISILAGVTIKKLQALTRAKSVVRAMPNLPAQIGMGVTLWTASPTASRNEKTFVKKIFGALGHEVELQNENMITKLSVISGCGPAYFFYLTELLENKARKLGLSQKEAAAIAKMTFLGTAELFARGAKTAAEWRKAVTSKRGVTEAVLKQLKNKKFDKIFYQALQAGIKRSNQLSK